MKKKTGTLTTSCGFSAGQGYYVTTLNQGDTVDILGIGTDSVLVCPPDTPKMKRYVERAQVVFDNDVQFLLNEALVALSVNDTHACATAIMSAKKELL